MFTKWEEAIFCTVHVPYDKKILSDLINVVDPDPVNQYGTVIE